MNKMWVSGMLASVFAVACSGGLPGQGAVEMGPDVGATSFALSDTDFSGNSIRIVGERDPAADLKYDCANLFDVCLNFDENGETDVLLGLCASSAQPAGGWNFDYQIFYGVDCPAGAEMFDIECASTVSELLPAGIVTTNRISCGADNAGKTWDFDMSGENPECPVGKTCVVLGGGNGGGNGGPQALEYGGEAKGIDANLLGVGTTVVHAGPVGPGAGSDSQSVATASVGTLRAGVVTGSTIAASNKTLSNAQVAGLNLTLAGIGISATAISAEALATCTGATPTIGATGLVINGAPVTLSGAPNEVLFDLLGVLKITANVVDTTGTGGDTHTVRVAALQIENSLLGSVVNTFTIAEAFSSVTCD